MPNKKMTESEMFEFIESVGRSELYNELEEIEKFRKEDKTSLKVGGSYPKYLKAIRVALIELGYDQSWVEGVFKKALEYKYCNKKTSS